MSQRQYQGCIKRGAKSEELFREAFVAKGNKLLKIANRQEQRLNHWDSLWDVNGEKRQVEIKGMKSLVRGLPPQDAWLLLELHGCDLPDNEGWLFGSTSYYMAFERRDDFVIFRTDALVEFVEARFDISGAHDPKLKRERKMRQWQEMPEADVLYFRTKDPFSTFVWVPIDEVMATVKHVIVKKID